MIFPFHSVPTKWNPFRAIHHSFREYELSGVEWRLEWTTGLEYWTGVEWSTGPKLYAWPGLYYKFLSYCISDYLNYYDICAFN